MKTFENVAQMQLATLSDNQLVRTKGQVTANDGLGVTFITQETATPSGLDIVLLASGNYAVTLTGEVRQNGVTPEMFDGTVWNAL